MIPRSEKNLSSQASGFFPPAAPDRRWGALTNSKQVIEISA
jgi:hypothetical protein